MGSSGESANPSHQVKKLDLDNLRLFRDRFAIPISDEDLSDVPYYDRADSPEIKYLQERRQILGGYLPSRRAHKESLGCPGSRHLSSRPRAQVIVRSRLRWPLFGCYRHWQRIRPLGTVLSQSYRMRLGRSAWKECSSNWVFIQLRAKNTSPMTSIRYCLIMKIKQDRFLRRDQ